MTIVARERLTIERGLSVRCAILDDYQNVALASADWSLLGPSSSVVVFHDHLADEDQLAARLQSCEVLVVMRERTPLPASLLDRLPALRLVVTAGMRNASIDISAAHQRGIIVCGTASNSEPPTEMTWALILALSRHLVDEVTALRSGGPWQGSVGIDLCGKRLGLLGLGKVGSRVARIGAAFGMDVVAWSPHLTEGRAGECGATLSESLGALLARSDVVSVHLVLGEGTCGLIGREELALMRSTAVLINTSRAAIVDQQALIEAVGNGTIAGAGLDVFDLEPLPADDPIRALRNMVATPHLGYVTQRNYASYFGQAVEDILAFAANKPIRELT